MAHPVVVVENTGYPTKLDELAPVETLQEAKSAARAAGYHVVDSGPGGDCETSSAWRQGEVVHLVVAKQEMPIG